jgi:hypothetical protein
MKNKVKFVAYSLAAMITYTPESRSQPGPMACKADGVARKHVASIREAGLLPMTN